jgi:two-component system, OmpR family, sensor histidine kinase KdpD
VNVTGYLRAALVMAACTVVGTALLDLLSVTDIAMLYLLGVGVVASLSTRRQAAFAALLSVALFDFFFVPPRFTFAVSDLHYVVTFGVMLVTALVISWLAERVRADAVATRSRERGTAALSPMSADLLDATSVGDVIAIIGRHARAAFGADVRVLLREAGGRLAAAGGSPETNPEDPDRQVAQWAFQSWERRARAPRTSPKPITSTCRSSAAMAGSGYSSCAPTTRSGSASPRCNGCCKRSRRKRPRRWSACCSQRPDSIALASMATPG